MSDEVTIVGDTSITDDETVVIGDATVVDKSTTDGDRGVVEGGESVIVNAMLDEVTAVDSSATDDVSGRNEVTGTIISNDTMSLDRSDEPQCRSLMRLQILHHTQTVV